MKQRNQILIFNLEIKLKSYEKIKEGVMITSSKHEIYYIKGIIEGLQQAITSIRSLNYKNES